jgi:hypothetical protein
MYVPPKRKEHPQAARAKVGLDNRRAQLLSMLLKFAAKRSQTSIKKVRINAEQVILTNPESIQKVCSEDVGGILIEMEQLRVLRQQERSRMGDFTARDPRR